MGLFAPKDVCSICKKQAKGMTIIGGHICNDCKNLCGEKADVVTLSKSNVEQVKHYIEADRRYRVALDNFKPSKEVPGSIRISDKQKQFEIPKPTLGLKTKWELLKFSDLLEFELLEDGGTISKGGLGRAVAGGVLFGGVGAVVGGVTGRKKSKSIVNSLRIKLTVDDLKKPTRYIDFIKAETKTDSLIYKTMYNNAQETLSVLEIINRINENDRNQKISEPEGNFKFCTMCGAKIDIEARFCSSCGEKIK